MLKSHPDLALDNKKLVEKLTTSSTLEQKGAGLTSLNDRQQNEFNQLNNQYKEKFKHPFIIAVKGKTRSQILRQFKIRYENTRADEFVTACREVEKIAYFRLKELF